jgi:hypothetical protein
MINPNIDFAYLDHRVAEADVHKAVESQGRVAIAAIEGRIDGAVSQEAKAQIDAWLGVLRTMLAVQANPTRDDSSMARYSDGSAVLRLVPDGTADVKSRDYLGDLDDDFDYLGDLAEYLSAGMPGYRLEVTDPPVPEPRDSALAAYWRENR